MARGSSVRDLLDRLSALYDRFFRDADDEDILELRKHLEGPYDSSSTEYGSNALRMSDIIRRAPRVPEDIVVYRGGHGRPSMYLREYPVSTSLDIDNALPYAEMWGEDVEDFGLLDKIEVPRGSPGLLLSDELFRRLERLRESMRLRPYYDGSEKELLLPKGEYEDLRVNPRGEFTVDRLRRFKPPYKARGGEIRGD